MVDAKTVQAVDRLLRAPLESWTLEYDKERGTVAFGLLVWFDGDLSVDCEGPTIAEAINGALDAYERYLANHGDPPW